MVIWRWKEDCGPDDSPEIDLSQIVGSGLGRGVSFYQVAPIVQIMKGTGALGVNELHKSSIEHHTGGEAVGHGKKVTLLISCKHGERVREGWYKVGKHRNLAGKVNNLWANMLPYMPPCLHPLKCSSDELLLKGWKQQRHIEISSFLLCWREMLWTDI